MSVMTLLACVLHAARADRCEQGIDCCNFLDHQPGASKCYIEVAADATVCDTLYCDTCSMAGYCDKTCFAGGCSHGGVHSPPTPRPTPAPYPRPTPSPRVIEKDEELFGSNALIIGIAFGVCAVCAVFGMGGMLLKHELERLEADKMDRAAGAPSPAEVELSPETLSLQLAQDRAASAALGVKRPPDLERDVAVGNAYTA